MIKLTLLVFFFLLSLLNLFRAPLHLLWYVSILTTEFCWLFLVATALVLFVPFGDNAYLWLSTVAGVLALTLFALPLVQAHSISLRLKDELTSSFPGDSNRSVSPFVLSRLMSVTNLALFSRYTSPEVITYDEQYALQFDLYRAVKKETAPCIVIIHGGSWAGGERNQLPELNSYLAANGFNVVCMEYRLAPVHHFPAPLEDVQNLLNYLKMQAAKLNIDTNNIVLVGRSAGGQVALAAAYTLKDPSIKGVISYYGPTDMVWGYHHPANPLVLDSKKVMEDYLGGTYDEVPEQYAGSSPVHILPTGAVPTLLIQGKNDPLVAYDHCNRLGRKLVEKNIPHFVLKLPWATHGCDYTLNGPAGQLSTFTTLHFLKHVTSR